MHGWSHGSRQQVLWLHPYFDQWRGKSEIPAGKLGFGGSLNTSSNVGGHQDWSERLPPSAMWMILEHLLLPDRIRFARTSRRNRRRCAAMLQSYIIELLASFGLSYGDIKLLQAATGTIISGSMIAALVHRPFQPNDIDFYCSSAFGDDVAKYLKAVGNFETQEYIGGEYSDSNGIAGVHWLVGNDTRVNVIETRSSEPLDAVLTFHSSGPRGALEWDRLSHYEVNRAARGIALITPTSLTVRNELTNQIRCWQLLHKYGGRGFRFTFQYDAPHECGVHLDCPATIRTTADAGTLRTPLLPVPISRAPSIPRQAISWRLGGTNCEQGLVNRLANVRPANSFHENLFRKTVTALLHMDAPPTSVVDVSPQSPYSNDFSSDIDME
ncbi:hypothetical protein B0H11DRAFT_2231156 [Mycena galericulata]|nr:hypothetical protein B0H11DRAFT_2261643 [Mycena galericulata]KAJ7486242.1 hypothetical protein B0H11DRAFT_2231156 [Mycena galericulata]